jgi:hypothetical protein
MSVLLDANAFRKAVLGLGPVSKATGTLSGTTFNIGTVAGGEVLLTAFWLKATTAISTDGGTLALTMVPTTGTTKTLVSATDLGTTDTAVGDLVGLTHGTSAVPAFLAAGGVELGMPLPVGTLKLTGASSVNGAVTAYMMWVPLVDGATLVAA